MLERIYVSAGTRTGNACYSRWRRFLRPEAERPRAPAGAARAAIAEESEEEEAGGAGAPPPRGWSDGELRALEGLAQTTTLPQGDPRKGAASSAAWARVAVELAERSGVGPHTGGAVYRRCVRARLR